MNKNLVALVTFLALCSSGPLHAESFWYAGGNFGSADRTDIDDQSFDFDEPGISISADLDTSDTGWKVLGGYRVNRNFAVEGAYVDLGEATLSGQVSVDLDLLIDLIDLPIPLPILAPPFEFQADFDAALAADGWSVTGVGILPLGEHFELFGKAGAFFWSRDISANLDAPFLPDLADIPGIPDINLDIVDLPELDFGENSGTEPVAGLGAQYNFSIPLSLRLELERYFDVAGSDIDLASFGLLWRI